MKKILIILLLFASLSAGAATYCVSTTGNDGAAGTLAAPWASWQKGFESLVAGDTLYIRGGSYTTMKGLYFGVYVGVGIESKYGTAENPIVVMNYQNEVPVLNCAGLTGAGEHVGISLYDCTYWYITGLSVRNVTEYETGGVYTIADAWRIVVGGDNIITRCSASYSAGGFKGFSDDIQYINCDSYKNHDHSDTGGYANGFTCGPLAGGHVYYQGCRAWLNSDDGFDFFGGAGYIEVDKCWAWANGTYGGMTGNGDGFKVGKAIGAKEAGIQRTVINCLSFNNTLAGFDESADDGAIMDMHIYNNTAYGNTHYGFTFWNETGTGIATLANNIAYNNPTKNLYGRASNVVTTCTFLVNESENSAYTVTNADFISVDSTGVSGARGLDGSLPQLTFLHLTANSDLKDRGTNVGLTNDGSGIRRGYLIDLGAYENEDIRRVTPDNNGFLLNTNSQMVLIRK